MQKTIMKFTHLENIYIKHELITIRRYQNDDFSGLQQIFRPDFFTWFFTKYDNCHEFVTEKLLEYASNRLIMLVIVDNKDNSIIGTTSLYDISLKHKRIEMGSSWISTNYQGTVVNTLTKYLLIDYLLNTLHFNRIQWKTDSLNEKSKQAMLKLGFIYEGTLRRHAVTYTGRIRDSLVFSVTDQDWDEVEKIMQARIKHKLAISNTDRS